MLSPAARACVLDTNIVLDVYVFADPLTEPLRQALAQGRLRWIATPAMREELARVLHYPPIARRWQAQGGSAEAVLQAMDAAVQWCAVPPKVCFTCKDADDQKFIDLAAAHGAYLLSKDDAVLVMKKRLARLGVAVGRTLADLGFGAEAVGLG